MNYIFYSVYRFIVQKITLAAQYFSLLWSMGLQFVMAKGHTLMVAGSRAARGKKKKNNNNLPNGLKYSVIFVVYTQFTNLVAGRWLETHVLMCVILRLVSAAVHMYTCKYVSSLFEITTTQTYKP
jgi:hypothetical protein